MQNKHIASFDTERKLMYLTSDSHLPTKLVLFASMKAL